MRQNNSKVTFYNDCEVVATDADAVFELLVGESGVTFGGNLVKRAETLSKDGVHVTLRPADPNTTLQSVTVTSRYSLGNPPCETTENVVGTVQVSASPGAFGFVLAASAHGDVEHTIGYELAIAGGRPVLFKVKIKRRSR